MKILVDTNVILDVFLMREEFLSDSYRVLRLCADNDIEVDGYAAVHTITNMHYIMRKNFKPIERREVILTVFEVLEIVPVDSEMLVTALKNFEFANFEDSLQYECANSIGADYIVTRNVKDFAASDIPVLTPEEFMMKWNSDIDNEDVN